MAINVARYTEWQYCDQRLSFTRQHPGNNTITNPTNYIVTLRAIREVWRDDSRPTPAHRPLSEYALDYRLFVQRTLWMALERGDLRTAVRRFRSESSCCLAAETGQSLSCPPKSIASSASSDDWLRDPRPRSA